MKTILTLLAFVCSAASAQITVPITTVDANSYNTPGLRFTYTSADGYQNQFWRSYSSDPNKASYGAGVSGSLWNGVIDEVYYHGYNYGAGGTRPMSTEPSLAWVWEQDYYAAGEHNFEHYLEWRGPTTHVRPISMSWNRQTEVFRGIAFQAPRIQRSKMSDGSTLNSWEEDALYMYGQEINLGANNPITASQIEAHSQNTSGISISNWNTTASGQMARLMFTKSDSPIIGQHVAVLNGDTLGFIPFKGSDGLAFQYGPYIGASVDGAVSVGIVPGSIDIYTRDSYGGFHRTRFRGTGNVEFGAAAIIPSIKAITGTRFVCVDTVGQLISQTTPCSGT